MIVVWQKEVAVRCEYKSHKKVKTGKVAAKIVQKGELQRLQLFGVEDGGWRRV